MVNRDKTSVWTWRVVVTLSLLLSAPASADEFHYENFRFGPDAMGMGGAVTSFIQSPEATFYNPAGLGFMAGSAISGALHFYGLDRRTLVEGYKTGGQFPNEDLVSSSFLALPASSVITFRLSPDHVLAYSTYLVVDEDESFLGSIAIDGEGGELPGNTSLTRQFQDRVLLIGPSYAWRASARLSLGASVFYARRDQSSHFIFSGVEENDDHTTISQEETNTQTGHNALIAQLGVQLRPADDWTLGLAVKSRSIDLGGDATVSHIARFTGVSPDDPAAFDNILSSDDLSASSVYPWSITAGVGYKRADTFRLALDVAVYLPVEYDRIDFSGSPELGRLASETFINTVKKELVINPRVGAELTILKDWSLRGGFYTNFSAAPEIADEDPSSLASQHIDLFGTTFSVGYFGDGKSITLGADLQWGVGQDTVIRDSFNFENKNIDRVQREQFKAIFFLSGAFEFIEDTASEYLPSGDLIGTYRGVKGGLDALGDRKGQDVDEALSPSNIADAPAAEQLGLLLARDQLHLEAERSVGDARESLARAEAVGAERFAAADFDAARERLTLAEEALEAENFATAAEHAQNADALFVKAFETATPAFGAEQAAMQKSHAALTALNQIAGALGPRDSVTIEGDKLRVVMPGLFNKKSSDPDASRLASLDDVVKALDETMKVSVEGHTTARVADEALGLSRAQAVRDALIAKGASAGAVTATSKGGESPRFGDKDDHRVELVILLE